MNEMFVYLIGMLSLGVYVYAHVRVGLNPKFATIRYNSIIIHNEIPSIK